ARRTRSGIDRVDRHEDETKDDAEVLRASPAGGPIERAVGRLDEPGLRRGAVPSMKPVDDREVSARPVHAKDVPEGLDGVSPSAFRRRTVEVAVARLHEGRVGSGAVEAREVM